MFLGPNHYLNYPSFSFIFQLSSQHPYLETFVGKPLVYTVNIWNRTEVTRTLKKVLKEQVKITLIFYHCYMGTAPYGGKGQNSFKRSYPLTPALYFDRKKAHAFIVLCKTPSIQPTPHYSQISWPILVAGSQGIYCQYLFLYHIG